MTTSPTLHPSPYAGHIAPGGFKHRLLIVAASPCTRHHPAPMPALQRYDSPEFRLLRARPVEQLAGTQVMILSARYALRTAEDEICDDGSRLSRERAGELVPRTTATLYTWLQRNPNCRTVCICGPRSSFAAFPGFDAWCARHHIAYTEITGPISTRMRQLRSWLTTKQGE